jgi:hypothetical protein
MSPKDRSSMDEDHTNRTGPAEAAARSVARASPLSASGSDRAAGGLGAHLVRFRWHRHGAPGRRSRTARRALDSSSAPHDPPSVPPQTRSAVVTVVAGLGIQDRRQDERVTGAGQR